MLRPTTTWASALRDQDKLEEATQIAHNRAISAKPDSSGELATNNIAGAVLQESANTLDHA